MKDVVEAATQPLNQQVNKPAIQYEMVSNNSSIRGYKVAAPGHDIMT